jgi:hypothetical protein
MGNNEYVALDWRVITNLGTEFVSHEGAIKVIILSLDLFLPNK